MEWGEKYTVNRGVKWGEMYAVYNAYLEMGRGCEIGLYIRRCLGPSGHREKSQISATIFRNALGVTCGRIDHQADLQLVMQCNNNKLAWM